MAQAQAGEGVNLSIIVTPMLDMAFQLLAFFVMTYHPSAFETQFEVQQTLPPEKQSKKKLGSGGGDPKDLKDLKDIDIKDLTDDPVDPKRAEMITIFLRAADAPAYGREKGDPTQISIKKPEGTEIISNAEDSFDKDTRQGVFMSKLITEIQRIKDSAGTDTELNLSPDADMKHKWVMYVMGLCRREGFNRISFVEPK